MRLVVGIKNKDIFDGLKNGSKKIETRASTIKFQKIKTGDVIEFSCGKEVISKKVSKVNHFKTITALLKVYKPESINPKLKTKKEIEDMYYSFTGYKEKIKEFGIVAFELK